MFQNRLLYSVMIIFMAGCIPKNLEKYRQANNTDPVDQSINNNHPNVGPAVPSTAKRQPAGKANKPPQQATIYALDDQTFRFTVPEKEVWNTALNVLMRNYNLTIVDKDSGVITTEWDSYYLDEKVFRNRLSLRMQRVNMNSVDVMVHNNVEKLQDGAALRGLWLPSEDKAQEVKRVIQNMAIMLNEPPPQFLKTMTAESDEPKEKRNF